MVPTGCVIVADPGEAYLRAYRGRLRVGFKKIATYKTPEDFNKITLNSMHEASEKSDKMEKK